MKKGSSERRDGKLHRSKPLLFPSMHRGTHIPCSSIPDACCGSLFPPFHMQNGQNILRTFAKEQRKHEITNQVFFKSLRNSIMQYTSLSPFPVFNINPELPLYCSWGTVCWRKPKGRTLRAPKKYNQKVNLGGKVTLIPCFLNMPESKKV